MRQQRLVISCVILASVLFVDLAAAQEQSIFGKIANAFTGSRPGRHYERMNSGVLEAFRDPVREVERSTVRVYGEGGQRSMGVVVDANGLILTKFSELIGDLSCKLPDGESVKADLIGVDKARDLALLQVGRSDLVPVAWSETKDAPPLGSWVVTPGNSALPLSIGVVSTSARNEKPEAGFLGVGLQEASGGVLINRVLEGGVAAKAGLRVNDLIVDIDGVTIENVKKLQDLIAGRRPNTSVDIEIVRDGESATKSVLLGRRSDAKAMAHEQRLRFQEQLGGKISERRDAFPLIYQHDSVLQPKDCGGPLVNLDGQVVGINVARASRIGSFAMPISEVLPALDAMKNGGGKEIIEQRAKLKKESAQTRAQLVALRKALDAAKRALEASQEEVKTVRVALKKDGAESDTDLQNQLQSAVDKSSKLGEEAKEAEGQVADVEEKLRVLKAKLISLRN